MNGDAGDYMYAKHGIFAFSPGGYSTVTMNLFCAPYLISSHHNNLLSLLTEVGPFFDYNPFSKGMWPPENEIADIVAESMPMAGDLVWTAGSYLEAKLESAGMCKSYNP